MRTLMHFLLFLFNCLAYLSIVKSINCYSCLSKESWSSCQRNATKLPCGSDVTACAVASMRNPLNPNITEFGKGCAKSCDQHYFNLQCSYEYGVDCHTKILCCFGRDYCNEPNPRLRSSSTATCIPFTVLETCAGILTTLLMRKLM